MIMSHEFEHIFTPYKIGNMTVKNRLCVSPMDTPSHYSGVGVFSDVGIEYFVRRAQGGFGLIFLGGAQGDVVDPIAALPNPNQNPDDYYRTGSWLTERVHAFDAKIIAQSSLGVGRAYCDLYAPSAVEVAFCPGELSRVLTKDQIKEKVEGAVKLAALQKSAGFDGVEIHAMHWGYLLDQFAMSITNHREDEYGGCLENRLRITREVVEGIRQECGANFPITIRFGLKSFIKGLNQPSLTGEDEAGRTIEESIKIAKMLEEMGIDALNTSIGTQESYYYRVAPMYMGKGYGLKYAAQVKAAVNIPVISAGRLDDPYLVEKAIADGVIDAAALGRPSIAEPDFPMKLLMGKPESIRPCLACNMGCVQRCFNGGDISCAVNPAAGRELTLGIGKALTPKKVVVIGGGVAGMETACTAKRRGHDVTLFEKNAALGGNAIAAGAHEFKHDILRLISWYERELDNLKVNVVKNHVVTAEEVRKMQPDAIVLATGSSAFMPNLPGLDGDNVATAIDVLLGKKETGHNVVIVGGGLTGTEMAVAYAQEGKSVTLVEYLDDILQTGPAVPQPNRMMLIDLLEHHKVKVITGCKLTGANEHGAMVEMRESGEQLQLDCDSVVVAIGMKSNSDMLKELYGCGAQVYNVGDSKNVANIIGATSAAYEVARIL